MTINLVNKIIKLTNETMTDYGIRDYSQIDMILMIGGTAKIPILQDMLNKSYNGEIPLKTVNPGASHSDSGGSEKDIKITEKTDSQLMVVIGGGIIGGKISFDEKTIVKNVIPLGLGNKISKVNKIDGKLYDGYMSTIIDKNTQYSCHDIVSYSTGGESDITFDIYEGNDEFVVNNYHLMTATIHNVPMCPADKPFCETLRINFTIDNNGILSISAQTNKDLPINTNSDVNHVTTGNLAQKAKRNYLLKAYFVYVIDVTGSMSSYIREVKNTIRNVIRLVKNQYNNIEFNVAVVGYRDYCDGDSMFVSTNRFETDLSVIDKLYQENIDLYIGKQNI